MKNTNLSCQQGVCVIKSCSAPIFIFQLLTADITLFTVWLTDLLLTQSFHQNTLILLDLQKVAAETEVDFTLFKQTLLTKKFYLVGVVGGSELHKKMAIKFDLYVLPMPGNIKNQAQAKNEPVIKYLSAKLVTTTVRSGQKIYARNRDLICTAAVNHGAELISDGNVHIYGKLSGRVLAGASGNKDASIFCTHLDAEFVAIAGFYDANLDITASAVPVQIRLIDEKLQIKQM